MNAETFLIVNGDTLCDFSLASMLEAHERSHAEVTLALVPNPAPDQYNGIVLDAEDRVTGWVPRGRAQGSWHFIGVQVARAAVFADLADGVPAESVAGLYQTLLTQPGRLRGYRPETTFLDVGTPRDYLEAALSLSGPRPKAPGQRPKAEEASARTVVWPEASVDPGAVLTECIVAGNIEVRAGFNAQQAVLVPAAVVKTGDRAQVRNGIAVFPMGA
jgi:mannose-1-phosphate guanylyltransferase